VKSGRGRHDSVSNVNTRPFRWYRGSNARPRSPRSSYFDPGETLPSGGSRFRRSANIFFEPSDTFTDQIRPVWSVTYTRSWMPGASAAAVGDVNPSATV
jgi:hypothetical protein